MKNILLISFMAFGGFVFGQENSTQKNSLQEQLDKMENDSIQMVFRIPGMNATLPKGTQEFAEKYGVEFRLTGCIITPDLEANNQAVADKLTEEFGYTWWDEIPIKPYGVSIGCKKPMQDESPQE